MLTRLALCLLITASLAGCNLAAAPGGAKVAASDGGLRIDATAASSRPTRTPLQPTSSQPASAPEAATQLPSRCGGDDIGRPARQIDAKLTIDYDAKTAQVDQVIRFYNRGSQPLDALVLDAQANQWRDSFYLRELAVNGAPAEHALALNRLDVALAEALLPGCYLEIDLRFELRPAEIRDGLRAYRGFFGYSARQLNLGHFLPTVAARVNGAWRIHQPVGIGEQVVHEVADWTVRVRLARMDESLTLAAPGDSRRLDNGSWRIELENSRDFALSLSDEWVVSEARLADGATLEVYSFADARIPADGVVLDGAAHVLDESAKAFQHFGATFGKYRRDRFVIVQGDFPDGMEFTGLVFVGGAWFYHFDGTRKNYLTLITVHEIAHQWWYARVGSDAALSPWLDEALATYSEYLFIEKHYPAEKNWWWSFRVAGFFPQGKVDSAVYEFSTARQYINAVYLRGVQMLHNLRVDIGDDAFFSLLRSYAAAGDGRIADPALFWTRLSKEQFARTEATRLEYLGDPAVVPEGEESS